MFAKKVSNLQKKDLFAFFYVQVCFLFKPHLRKKLFLGSKNMHGARL
jgi:hypothetical protein